ncbi:MAG: phage integrase SAM-like domain-containing protein [Bacteroidota bacterium]
MKLYLEDSIIVNTRIDKIIAAVSSVASYYVSSALKPSSAQFFDAVNLVLNPKPEPNQYFVPFTEQYYPTLNRTKESLKKIVTTVNKLKEYEELYNCKLCFSDLDMNFYNNFKKYFASKNYSLNFFGGIIRTIRYFFSCAKDLKLHNLILPKAFRAPSAESDNIYLTIDELITLHNLVINENLILDKLDTKAINVFGSIEKMILSLNDCKDRFLIGSFTGFRFSDYSLLSGLSSSDNFISKRSLKTNIQTIIPMHQVIKEILTRRNNILPPPISNQRLNKQLKVIGKLAGFNDIIEITMVLVTGKTKTRYNKYELMCTHTARRSFCTNAFLAGIDILSIMSFSGHKTTSSFLKYIKASQTVIATRLQSHSFFTIQKK